MDTNPTHKGGADKSELLIARARDIAPMLRECAAKTEADRRVSAEIIAALQQAELFQLMQPSRFGGFELGFDTLVRVADELGQACGSAAWVWAVIAFHNWQVALFPLDGQEELWRADPRALIASSYAPTGTAVPAEGGLRVSGKWTFASGCDVAQWMVLGAQVQGSDGFDPRWVLISAEDVTIDDNWTVSGLAGTGSKNILVEDKFVPARRVLDFASATAGTSPGSEIHANPLYKIPFFAVASYCLVAPGLGVAQGAFHDYMEMTMPRTARGKDMKPGGTKVTDFDAVQMRVSEASGLIDAARLLLLRDCAETQAAVSDTGDVSLEQRAKNKRDQALAIKFCKDAVRLLFEAAGGAGLFQSSPLQRAARDVHAVGCHLTLNWDAVIPVYGRVLFGKEPGITL